MKPVTVGGKKYRIIFSYPHKHSRKRDTVKCIVVEQTLNQNLLVSTPYVGVSNCNIKEDIFDKEVGRKMSLSQALAPLNREVRSALWRSYWGRFTLTSARSEEIA